MSLFTMFMSLFTLFMSLFALYVIVYSVYVIVTLQVTHVFSDYPKGVRKVKVTHRGKDKQFWAGHYGSKFTGTEVKLIINVT